MLLRSGALSDIRKNRKRNDNKGFTMAEVLIVIAIVLILVAVSVMSLILLQRNLRQKELDAKAEIIYMAAQNQLINLRSSGTVYDEGTLQTNVPHDMNSYYENGSPVVRTIKYITCDDPASAKDLVLPFGTVDEELRNNNWVIEYEPSTSTVYAVYYSVDEEIQDAYPGGWTRFDGLREKDQRLKEGAHVGYYGGDAVAGNDATKFNPTIIVSNGDELKVILQCNIPLGLTEFEYEFTMEDEDKNVYKKTFKRSSTNLTEITYDGGRSYHVDVVLDNLSSSDKRFNKLYGSESTNTTKLVPGENLKLSLTVKTSTGTTEDGTAHAITNSLYADDTVTLKNKFNANNQEGAAQKKGVAVISCARHLQNLDTSSGISSIVINKAEQDKKSDIDFRDNVEKTNDWYSLYRKNFFNGISDGKANFKPISNDFLEEYDGNKNQIISLYTSASGTNGAGLFDHSPSSTSVTKFTVKNVRLAGPYVQSANGTAGGLIASVSKNTEIENVCLYLTRANIRGINASDKSEYKWIKGSNAGGLIGTMSGGSVEIIKSSASTVIGADADGGGLVGHISGGSLSIDQSYADNYIYGLNTGGLACGDVSSIEDSYAAGFHSVENASGSEAGLVNGSVDSANRCYTIVTRKPGSDERPAFYSTARAIGATSVYFLLNSSNSSYDFTGTTAIGGMDKGDLQGALGGSFTTSTSDATPYRLMDQPIETYPYPAIDGVRHYGDWPTQFQNGALVYYEKYTDNQYGFYGASTSRNLLRDKGIVVGDGYGIVFERGSMPTSGKVFLNGTEFNLNDLTHFELSDPEKSYVVYLLPERFWKGINPASSGSFYTSISIKSGNEEKTFYYNPLFAKTVTENSVNTAPPVVYIRSARHLYNLSKYYDDDYRTMISDADSSFEQEMDLNYRLYDWTNFHAISGEPDNLSQKPIGATKDKAFNAEYNGLCHSISEVNFVSDSGSYIGLFGYNEGTINDTVVAYDYKASGGRSYLIKRNQAIRGNVTVYMGVLAGYNAGTISNCATAGYYLAGTDGTLHTYNNSTLYVGGLVGGNGRTIENSSADCPEIRLSSLYATVGMGGFVGRNTAKGTITNSYSLSYLEISDAKGESTVAAGGFAGSNQGAIRNSYCATAIKVSGQSESYGFSPSGGVTTGCEYLNYSTYFYVSDLRSYNYPESTVSGIRARYYDELESESSSAAADSNHSFNHPNTNKGKSAQYPFRAVVHDSSGNYVHYGDWPELANLGMRGMFYWEHETGGSNNGYHITYLGATQAEEKVTGTTLCYAHDDGGKIDSYGYGYYTFEGVEATLKDENGNPLNDNTDLVTSGSSIDGDVQEALEKQLNKYHFYPYTAKESNVGDNYITLKGNDDQRMATVNLEVTNSSLNTLKYRITPFFANSMQLMNSSTLVLTTDDLRDRYFNQELGNKSNTYEVRSIDQLAFINWNNYTKNCSTLVYGKKGDADSGNFKQFPFLQYATVVGKGIQKKADVLKNRPVQYWVQSHDLSGPKEDYTPIAGMATSSPYAPSSYINILFAWFGGSYDGQSYKIENLDINSPSFTVGLFGVTAGADIKNVIMYSDWEKTSDRKPNTIVRDTAGKTGHYYNKGQTVDVVFEDGSETATGAYSIGGLIGIAYEYNGQGSKNTISNCAIAGYKIIDKSTNRQGAGTANVGGLIGLANVNLKSSSSVCEIKIDCTHNYGHNYYGSYVRVGGLAGSAGAPGTTLSVMDCYTGGKITISEDCLNEKPEKYTSDGYAQRDGKIDTSAPDTKENRFGINNIFASGMIGGSYAPNISNFTGIDANQPDGKANISNCYTYLKLPNLEGTVRSVSLFASQADRYCKEKNIITIDNCYYLEGVNDDIEYPKRNDPFTWPDYFFEESKTATKTNKPTPEKTFGPGWRQKLKDDPALREQYEKLVISETEFKEEMLQGNLKCLKLYLAKAPDGKYATPKDPATAKDYGELCGLAGTLGSAWGTVSTEEGPNKIPIDGKYSFSPLPEQDGQNYPFPTVIQQMDNTYSTKETGRVDVNVHYGEWVNKGCYWKKGRDTIDIFSDMDAATGVAVKEFELIYDGSYSVTYDDINISEPELAEVVRDPEEGPVYSGGKYKIKIKAKKVGSVTITENNSGASFNLDITGRLKITSDPDELLLTKNETKPLDLKAWYKDGDTYKEFTKNGTWTLTPDSDAFTKDDEAKTITGAKAGSGSIVVTFTYVYDGEDEPNYLSIPARTLGYIGLYNNNNETKKYDGIWRGTDNNKTPDYDPEMPGGPDMFIFGSVEDEDFRSFKVKSIEVTDSEGGKHPIPVNATLSEIIDEGSVTDEDKNYTLSFGVIDSGEHYSYVPIYIRSSSSAKSVKDVLFRLEEPDDSGKSAEYDLSAENVGAEGTTVSFDKGEGATGKMYPVRINTASYDVPECAFSKKGYEFDYWSREGDNNKYSKNPPAGSGYLTTVSDIDSDFTLVANWKPIKYNVHFNANGGDSSGSHAMSDLVDKKYDEEFDLPENKFGAPSGRIFKCWNTEYNGTGTSYKDKQSVSNLATVNGKTVTLYAIWKDANTNTLTLVNNNDSDYPQDFENPDGESNLDAFDYTQPSSAYWELQGWYTSEDKTGKKVLDADGNIVEDVSGITAGGVFSLNDDVALYAKWKTESYLPIESLDKAESGSQSMENHYLILATNTAGTGKAMRSNGDSGLSAVDINITDGDFLDKDGKEYTVYISNSEVSAETVAENKKRAVWNVIWREDSESDIGMYSFENVYNAERGKNAYLRDNGGSSTCNLANSYMIDSKVNDKHVWNYSDRSEGFMLSEFNMSSEKHLAKGSTAHPNDWYTNLSDSEAPERTVYLFKKQDVYTFYKPSGE